nr:lipase family protein [Paenibacillus hamazuiensis]
MGEERFPYLGFIIHSKEKVIVAFRGTENLNDLLSDFDWEQVPYPYIRKGGHTHKGFTELYARAVRNKLLRRLGRLAAGGRQLVLAGHSSGGALATLCAPDIAAHTAFRRPSVVTFGSPRVGDSAFVAAFRRSVGESIRIFNENDVVPLFPPSFGQYDYQHVHAVLTVRFQAGNPLDNHKIRAYYRGLASLLPSYAGRLCRRNPGFCPESSAGSR